MLKVKSHFDAEFEAKAQKMFNSLNEKERRRFAAVLYDLSNDLGYISKLLDISEKTIRRGSDELSMGKLLLPNRQREIGGGRKNKWNNKEINDAVMEVIQPYLAGDPTNPEIKWTNLSHVEISDILKKEKGVEISKNTVKKVLKANKFKKRKIQKRKSLKKVANRDTQFKEIQSAIECFKNTGDPIISTDTKKKEDIGGNVREGASLANGQIDGPDHSFSDLNEGKAVPHGIYDLRHNKAYIHIGNGSETAEFIIDSIIKWWEEYGKKHYSNAKKILILCDAGGANSYRHHIFKIEIIRLAQELGLEIVIKHYPSYASKWNPIEHRVFCHVHHAISGVFIRTFDEFRKLVNRAKTKTGLVVVATIIEKVYEIGKRADKEDWEGKIRFSDILPQWNYSASPVF